SSTALTYHYDQDILDGVQEFGREVGLGNEDNTKTVWRAGPYPLLRLPTDTGSSLYFFGDGWVHVGTAVGFLLTGYWGEFTRPWNTGLQLFHGMFVSTLFSQAIKRATGRESPTEQTTDRGAWRPFPSINAYNKHTARYDAYPSGHIMTATLTFTMLAENYPEHSYWIFPLEVTWLTLLGLQMINNGVHWASDYPLGIAMGYQIGKISSRMGKTKGNEKRGETQSLFKNSFFYTGLVDNTPTFNVFISY
ncbi:MAG: phosphatase PAP2 family protein, partial [Bdellovibrionales bacterium]|nr:phosphatase PAP2 family protein [Bdellovibrionales bacterium]